VKRRLFGTDGMRRVANLSPMTLELALIMIERMDESEVANNVEALVGMAARRLAEE
jgi:hypothetical protein